MFFKLKQVIPVTNTVSSLSFSLPDRRPTQKTLTVSTEDVSGQRKSDTPSDVYVMSDVPDSWCRMESMGKIDFLFLSGASFVLSLQDGH